MVGQMNVSPGYCRPTRVSKSRPNVLTFRGNPTFRDSVVVFADTRCGHQLRLITAG
jgi:hypothetical protein